jgi:hypothetical protein
MNWMIIKVAIWSDEGKIKVKVGVVSEDKCE